MQQPWNLQIEKLWFLGIAWYKFQTRFWFNLNLYRGICVSGFGVCGRGSIFSGYCHTSARLSMPRLSSQGSLCGELLAESSSIYVWVYSFSFTFSLKIFFSKGLSAGKSLWRETLFTQRVSFVKPQTEENDKAPTNKICHRASSEQRLRTRSCHESERLV